MSEWLRRIEQGWKLKLGIAWILAGIVLLVVAIALGVPSLAWILTALGFAIAGFGWTAFAVRCPACRKRAVFWAMLYEPGHGWLRRMMTTDRCPVCQDTGARRA